jgi:hypothetical protein
MPSRRSSMVRRLRLARRTSGEEAAGECSELALGAIRAEDLGAQRVVVLLSKQRTPAALAVGLDVTALRAAEDGRGHARILARGERER